MGSLTYIRNNEAVREAIQPQSESFEAGVSPAAGFGFPIMLRMIRHVDLLPLYRCGTGQVAKSHRSHNGHARTKRARGHSIIVIETGWRIILINILFHRLSVSGIDRHVVAESV
jgi:hypothetical protein